MNASGGGWYLLRSPLTLVELGLADSPELLVVQGLGGYSFLDVTLEAQVEFETVRGENRSKSLARPHLQAKQTMFLKVCTEVLTAHVMHANGVSFYTHTWAYKPQ